MEKMTVNNEAFFGNVITLLRKGKKVTSRMESNSQSKQQRTGKDKT